jgi:lipooligosaccharide transport system permease protein
MTPRTVEAGTAPRTPLEALGRQADYWLIVYRRTWKGSVVSSFVIPVLYVLAMGVLLGRYVDSGPSRLDGAPSYLAFVAPGLLAAQSMQTAFGEATYPVLSRLKWDKAYFSMGASPLSVGDIVLAHLAYAGARVALGSLVFVLVLAPFGVYAGVGGAVLAFLVQLLVGLAFATPLYAFSAGLRDESAFSLVFRLGMIPLFLFSGAFFPITNLAGWMQVLARATPLWHGVDLTRMLTLGRLDAGAAAVHVGYLLVLVVAGHAWAVRRLGRRMVA